MVSSLAFFAAFAAAAALRRFFWALTLACAAHASGSQSLQTRQGLSWVQSGCPSFKRHCWQRRWLSFLRRKCEHPGNLGWDSAEDDRSRDRSAILSTQRRRHGFTRKPTWPNSAWDLLASLRTATHYSSFFVFDKRLGRPLVQWVIGLASVH